MTDKEFLVFMTAPKTKTDNNITEKRFIKKPSQNVFILIKGQQGPPKVDLL